MTSFELPNFPLTVHAIGSPQEKTPLQAVQRTIQSLQADELLVKVDYASLNPMDPKILEYNFFHLPYPLVLGFDFSGVVAAVGGHDAAPHTGHRLEVGTMVFGFTGRGACFADYLVVKRTVVLPRGAIPAAEASTYGVAYNTAYESIEVTGEVSKLAGKWVYIAGGSGGVGHFAVQIARAYGARVIASASKPDALALLKKLGVEHVINYSKQDVAKELLQLTGGRGVDLSYDPTYQASAYKAAVAGTAQGGRAVKLGDFSDADKDAQSLAKERGVEAVVGDWGRYSTQPKYQAEVGKVTKGLEAAVQWYAEGKVRPHISATVPFEAKALQKAMDDIGQGKGNVGKVVVKIH